MDHFGYERKRAEEQRALDRQNERFDYRDRTLGLGKYKPPINTSSTGFFGSSGTPKRSSSSDASSPSFGFSFGSSSKPSASSSGYSGGGYIPSGSSSSGDGTGILAGAVVVGAFLIGAAIFGNGSDKKEPTSPKYKYPAISIYADENTPSNRIYQAKFYIGQGNDASGAERTARTKCSWAGTCTPIVTKDSSNDTLCVIAWGGDFGNPIHYVVLTGDEKKDIDAKNKIVSARKSYYDHAFDGTCNSNDTLAYAKKIIAGDGVNGLATVTPQPSQPPVTQRAAAPPASTPPQQATPQNIGTIFYTVTATALNVRDSQHTVMHTIKQDSCVAVNQSEKPRANGFIRAQINLNGQKLTGFVHTDYLRPASGYTMANCTATLAL